MISMLYHTYRLTFGTLVHYRYRPMSHLNIVGDVEPPRYIIIYGQLNIVFEFSIIQNVVLLFID